MLQPDYFSIICDEICNKQNGIQLKQGDHSALRESFLSKEGDIDRLVMGVLSQYDILKGVIIDCYRSGRIASDAVVDSKVSISVDIASIKSQQERGRTAGIELAKRSLGSDVVQALLGE